MTSASFRGALFFLLLASSSGLKTETIVEMRNDIMMEHTSAVPASRAELDTKATPKSLSSKVKENFDALEVAIAVQMASQQRLAGFVQGSVLLVVLAALGLYAIKKQPDKKGKEACIDDYAAVTDVKSSPAPAPVEVPTPTPAEIEEELDMYLERQRANEDCAEESWKQELNNMLDESLEAEAAVVCMPSSAPEQAAAESRADTETRELIENELDRYLDHQNANKDLDADMSNLKMELNRMLDDSFELHGLNKMLDASLEAEAQAAMVLGNAEEEVDVSRIEKEIAEQFSEALGFSQVPAWME